MSCLERSSELLLVLQGLPCSQVQCESSSSASPLINLYRGNGHDSGEGDQTGADAAIRNRC
jgi:hypothetical protein